MKKTEYKKIQKHSGNIRRNIIEASFRSNKSSHFGGSLSIVDILSTLYCSVLNYKIGAPEDSNRDRFILSKGHGALALYCTLYEFGFIKDDHLESYMQNESDFIAHPIMNLKYGIESSNGSLGHGLSMAVGVSLAAKMKNLNFRTFVMMGDGECNEGSVWEAVMAGANYGLGNLIAIVDRNNMQNDGDSNSIMKYYDLVSMWRSFGWEAIEIDGHDILSILNAFQFETDRKKPKVVIANTIKGRGISFMENNSAWHHGKLTESLYSEAIESLSPKGN